MLRAHAAVDAVEPGLQIGVDEVDHRHELFGHFGFAAFGNCMVVEAPLAQAGIAPLVERQSIEQMMASSREHSEQDIVRLPPDEERSIVHQALTDHYRNTLDEPIPALGNQTPREAVKTAKGRKKVIASWLIPREHLVGALDRRRLRLVDERKQLLGVVEILDSVAKDRVAPADVVVLPVNGVGPPLGPPLMRTVLTFTADKVAGLKPLTDCSSASGHGLNSTRSPRRRTFIASQNGRSSNAAHWLGADPVRRRQPTHPFRSR